MTEFGIQRVAVNGGRVYVQNANGFTKPEYTQVGDTAILKFEEKKPENFYQMMGADFSAKLEEPQGENDDKKVEDKGTEGKSASVTVGDGNGTTIIIIGDNNEVNVGGTDKAGKAEDPDKADEAEDPDKAEEAEDPDKADKNEQPEENHNKKVIDTLKEIIMKLLELITGEKTVEEPEKAEEPEEVEKPEKPEKPEEPEEEKPAAPANKPGDAEKIKTLKEVIMLLLGLVEADEPAKEEKEAEKKAE